MLLLFGRKACGILAPWLGFKRAPCMGRQSLNQWTTREVPPPFFLNKWTNLAIAASRGGKETSHSCLYFIYSEFNLWNLPVNRGDQEGKSEQACSSSILCLHGKLLLKEIILGNAKHMIETLFKISQHSFKHLTAEKLSSLSLFSLLITVYKKHSDRAFTFKTKYPEKNISRPWFSYLFTVFWSGTPCF